MSVPPSVLHRNQPPYADSGQAQTSMSLAVDAPTEHDRFDSKFSFTTKPLRHSFSPEAHARCRCNPSRIQRGLAAAKQGARPPATAAASAAASAAAAADDGDNELATAATELIAANAPPDLPAPLPCQPSAPLFSL